MSRKKTLTDFFTKRNENQCNDLTETEESGSRFSSKLQVKSTSHFVRKYDCEYLKFGFIIAPSCEESLPKPQCVICKEILSNECMKPSKLSRHLNSKHNSFSNKPVAFFERKKIELKKEVSSFKKSFLVESSIVKASYMVALRVAKSKKPYTIAEELIKPCMLDVAMELFDSGVAEKLKTVSLSNDTMQRRIFDLSDDVESQLVNKIKDSKFFAIQMDESTDVSNKAILLCYVRYIEQEIEDVKEELLCCLELKSFTTSAEIFDAINNYLCCKEIPWKKCIGLCTDGAASMTGKHSGVLAKIRSVASENMIFTHCFIHREHLAAKKLSTQLNDALTQAVKIVNFIRASALNSRLFEILCREMGSEHEHLLLHAEVRWLSRGKVLTRLYELRHEVKILLVQKKSAFYTFINDNKWIAKLAYMSDIFSFINDLNTSLQGTNNNVYTFYNKIDAFKEKMKSWVKRIEQKNFEMFPSVSDFVKLEEVNEDELKSIIMEHIQSLIEAFDNYYPAEDDLRVGNMWIYNPFLTQIENDNLNHTEKDMVIEIRSDLGLKTMFSSVSLSQFWIKLETEYPILFEKAMRILLPFTTTYLCEVTFSAMTLLKTKQRNRLDVRPALRVAVSSINPNIDKLVKSKEIQRSH